MVIQLLLDEFMGFSHSQTRFRHSNSPRADMHVSKRGQIKTNKVKLKSCRLLECTRIVAKNKDYDPVRGCVQEVLVVPCWALCPVLPAKDCGHEDIGRVGYENSGEHKVNELYGIK